MPRALVWTSEQDATIRRMRAESATWDTIAAVLGISRWTLIKRGERIGAHLPIAVVTQPLDMFREPLPAGHPISWGAITGRTCLAGMPYPPRQTEHKPR